MIAKFLTSIGLTEKESALYLALQRFGTQPTSVIAKKTNMNRGTAYLNLHTLLKRGLVSKMVKNRVQYFAPTEPNRIIDYIRNQETELQKRKEEADFAIEQITLLQHPLAGQPSIEYLDGVDGARTAILKTLKAKQKTIYAFTSLKDFIEFLGIDFLNDYTKRRVQAGYTLNIIRTKKRYTQAIKKLSKDHDFDTNVKEKRNVRYIADTMHFPVSMYMFDEKIVIISTKKEGFAVIITSKETAGMQQKLFKVFWDMLARQ